MTLMARLGFDVPPHGLLPFKPENDGDDLEYAFVIRRFDQEGEKDVAAGFNTQYGEYLGMDFLVLGQSMGLSERLASALLKRLLKSRQWLNPPTVTRLCRQTPWRRCCGVIVSA